MMTWPYRSVVVSGALALAGPISAQPEPPTPAVEWMNDVDASFEMAKARRAPVFLDFYADWCEPCQAMDESVWPDSELGEAMKRVVPVRVDFDESRKLNRRYEVHSIPTMIFVDPWGTELGRIVGYKSPPEMLERLEVLPPSFAAVASYQTRVAENKDDAEALVRIGTYYRANGLLNAADAYFERAIKTSKKGKRDPTAAAEAYLGLGLNHLDRGEYKDARKNFEPVVKKFPTATGHAHALLGLIVARARLGDVKKAQKELARLEREHPDFESLDAARRVVSEAAQR